MNNFHDVFNDLTYVRVQVCLDQLTLTFQPFKTEHILKSDIRKTNGV